MSSAYFMDVSPQYRDNGCPSQCMGMNEYSTVANMYSSSTDPATSLLRATPATPFVGQPPVVAPAAPVVAPTTFGIQDPSLNYRERYGDMTAPSGFVYPVSGSIKSSFAMARNPITGEMVNTTQYRSPNSTYGNVYPVVKQGYANGALGPNAPVHLNVNQH